MAWLTGWTNRVKLTVDGTVPGLSGSVLMPAQVAIPSALKAVCQASGQDLRITTSDGETLLPYGLEDWSAANPVAHFRGTFGTGDTEVYAYGDNSLASDAQSKSSVAAGCELYLPLGDSGPTTAYDWTVNGNDGAATGGVTFGQAAKVADGVELDGVDGEILSNGVDNNTFNFPFTVASWIYKPANTSGILFYAEIQPNTRFYIWASRDAGRAYQCVLNNPTGTWTTTVNAAIQTATWLRLVVQYDGGSLAIYTDGTSRAVDTSAAAPITRSNLFPFRIGNQYGTSDWDGSVDQFEIATTAWSVNQIAFDAKSFPGSPMFSWGQLESEGGEPSIIEIPPMAIVI